MGTMKTIGGATGGTVVQAGNKSINLISERQVNAIVQAIRESGTKVLPADAEVQVDVHVPETPQPAVNVTNEVVPTDVIVNHQVLFRARHIYFGVLLHTLVLVLLGALAYVAIPKLDQYINPGYGPVQESRSGLYWLRD